MTKNVRNKKIVVIGGGTGTYTTLTGLKKYPVKLSAIISMTDSGGSNRVIRDEFGLLLPRTVQADAEVVVKRLQETADRAMQENTWPVSLSIGVVSFDVPPATVTMAIRRADERMYATKRAGKNAIQFEHVASA